MKKKQIQTKVVVEIAIFAAVAVAFELLQTGLWRGVFTNGGSIGFSIVPILLIGYRRGGLAAFITGLIVSLIQMLGGIYVIASTWYNVLFQVSLDYLFAFPIIALCALTRKSFLNNQSKKKRIFLLAIGSLFAGLGKFFLHFLAGILFWKNFDFKGGYVLYSLVYNGAYMLPNIIIAIIVIIIVFLKIPQSMTLENEVKADELQENN